MFNPGQAQEQDNNNPILGVWQEAAQQKFIKIHIQNHMNVELGEF